MHHELLLAAVGCPGDIVVPITASASSASSSYTCTYEVAPDITFLSAGR